MQKNYGMEIKIFRITNNNKMWNAETLKVDTLWVGFDNKYLDLDLYTKKI